MTNTAKLLFEASRECANIVFEGAHASLLDIDHGTYPFVTSSHCVAGGACIGTGVGPTLIDRVIGVVKAYATRVGEGPFPTELACETGDRIRKNGNEYGTTTGRPRRCGWFDAVAVKFTSAINGTSCIALMLLDVLSGFETVKICAHYEIDGKRVTDFPTDSDVLAKAVPIYEELPGWSEDISRDQAVLRPARERQALRRPPRRPGGNPDLPRKRRPPPRSDDRSRPRDAADVGGEVNKLQWKDRAAGGSLLEGI